MPLYEYGCSECDVITEAIQKFDDEPLTECPECGGKLKKLISKNSFSLKGDGWYVSEYGSKKNDPKD